MAHVQPDLTRLAAPFLQEDVEWKPGATTRDKTKGLAMAYISSRAVQDRLDEVCGPDGWRNEFRQAPEGGVLCGISIRVVREDGTPEWITKWDGAENTDVEAVKGGLSGAMKRAAVQWGIGRYLYRMPQQWVRLDERGRFAETPRIPGTLLPSREERGARAEVPRRAESNGGRAAGPGPFDAPNEAAAFAPQPGARRVVRQAARPPERGA